MISYEGLDEAVLIHGLYHGTGSLGLNTPTGIIDFVNGGARVTVEAVAADIAERNRDGQIRIDYYRGRPLKVNLDTEAKTFEERLYDRDAGEGAAARVVAALQSEQQ
jgi:hypothetical protein